jgi:hypothetical protein
VAFQLPVSAVNPSARANAGIESDYRAVVRGDDTGVQRLFSTGQMW